MRTQIAKTEYLPPSIFRLHFWLVPPPPFAQVDGGGCYREKFFLILFFLIRSYSQNVWIENIFLFFWLRFRILFFQNPNFNSLQVISRYSPSASFYIHHVWISRFQTLNFDSFLLVPSCVNYTLRLFTSLTLLLVINKHLCLYKFVLCLCEFGLCLFLAILRLSDVFSFVLGVVYRLGLK